MVDTSVIITNYNKGRFIGRCIRSCLKQSLPRDRYEIIVVDDFSTDNSRIVIDSFEDEIKKVYLVENMGVAGASNEGIKKALGSLIIRVDADDYISENTLLFFTEILLSNKDIGFVYGDHILVDDKEDFLGRVDLNNLENVLDHGAGIMFRKTNIETIGLYDPAMRHAYDYDLLKRYYKNFDGYHLRLPLYRYRQHAGNQTKLNKRQEYIKKSDAKNNR